MRLIGMVIIIWLASQWPHKKKCRKPKSNDNGIYEREIEREKENGG